MLSPILRLCFRDRWHITQRTLLDSRLGKQINFYYCFCMPALFSRDWQFHHTATWRRDDGGGRHESGRRTKRRLVSSALRLSLSPFFTLTSLFMFPRAGFCFAILSAQVFFTYLFLVLVAVFTFQDSVAEIGPGLLTPHPPNSFFILHLMPQTKGTLHCAYATRFIFGANLETQTQKWDREEQLRRWPHTCCSFRSARTVAVARPTVAWGLSHCSSRWGTRSCWFNPNTLAHTFNIRIKKFSALCRHLSASAGSYVCQWAEGKKKENPNFK